MITFNHLISIFPYTRGFLASSHRHMQVDPVDYDGVAFLSKPCLAFA